MSSNSKSTLEIWKRGYSMRDALFAFGDPQTASQLKEIWDSHPSLIMLNAIAEQLRTGGKISPEFVRGQELNSRGGTLQKALATEISGKLAAGELIAYGYSLPRAPDDLPRQVPGDIFGTQFVWRDDDVRGNGLRFAAVRVLRAAAVAKVQENARGNSTDKINPKPRGPRSRQEQIAASIASLLKEGHLDPSASHKVNVEKVRARVRERHPGEFVGDKGLSDETIRRVLVSELKRAFSRQS